MRLPFENRPRPFLVMLGLLMAMPAGVAAQSIDIERFTPLAQGGYWEYTLTESSEGWQHYPAYVSLEVRGDTVVAGQSYALLLVREYGGGDLELVLKVCGIGTDDNGLAYTTNFYGGHCTSAIPIDVRPLHAPGITVQHDRLIEIGGLTYPVAATATMQHHGQGPGGSGGGSVYRYAADIGLYYHHYYRRYHVVEGGGMDFVTYELNYAEVGEETYGAAVVSVEDAPPAAPVALSIASVFPNPTRGTFHIQLREVLVTPMDFVVYDVVGRRVASGVIPVGSSEARVDLGPGSSGVLLLRLSDGLGHSESRRLTRIPGSVQ